MKKYLLSFAVLLCGMCLFTSCGNDDEPDGPAGGNPEEEPIIEPVYVNSGMFILNEGNYYDKINGSLSFLDFSTNTLTDGLFSSANGRSLGGTPNDMVSALGRLYICCTDENRVEVVSASDYKSISSVPITQPRSVCASTSGVYVTSYDGSVYFVNYEGKIAAISDKIGDCLEGVCEYGGFVYVCNAYKPGETYTYNTKVVKLRAETLENVDEITVAANPTEIKVGQNGLYVLSSGNYFDVQSQLQRIDTRDGKVTYVCDATNFCLDGDNIYAINSVTDWATYTTTTEYFKIDGRYNRTALLTDEEAAKIDSPCGIAVSEDRLFISSYSMGAYGFADYSAAGYVMEYKTNGTFVNKYAAGVGPCTMVPYIVEQEN